MTTDPRDLRRVAGGGAARLAVVSLPSATWAGLLSLAAALFVVAVWFDGLTGAEPVEGFTAFAVPLAAMAVVTGTVGFVIRLRRPANRVGALMAYGPVLMLSGFVAYGAGALRMITHGPDDVLGGLTAAFGSAAVVPGITVTFPAVALVFPDGRLAGPRWRPLAIVLVAMVLTGSALTLVAPSPDTEFLPANPLALPGLPADVGLLATMLSTLALVIAVALAVAAVVVRFRRSRGMERQQLKWLVFSVAVAGLLLPFSFATDLGPAGLVDVVSVIAVAFVPLTIGIGILRYRLYDIDRIISRTVAYAALSGLLALVFVSVNLALGSVVAGAAGGGTLVVAAATLIVAALFQPVRRAIQGPIDRRFNRTRIDAERVVAAFAARTRDEVDLAVLRASVVASARTAVEPGRAGLWLRSRT